MPDGLIPPPERFAEAVSPGPPATVRVAVLSPAVVGVNATETLQVALAARAEPSQVLLVIVNSDVLTVDLSAEVGAMPPFLTVRTWAGDVVPTFTVMKSTLAGLTVRELAAPLRLAVPVPPG